MKSPFGCSGRRYDGGGRGVIMRAWVILLGLSMVLFCSVGFAVTEKLSTDVFSQPETLVSEIYAAVSSTPGNTPDWNRVRSFFDEDALIVLRTSKEHSNKLDLEGFIQDFKDFYGRIDPETTTFTEKIVSLKLLEYGNIAQVYVVFEVTVAPSQRPPQRGLDSWHLMKTDGRWKVISVVNDSEVAVGPIPDEAFAD